MVFAVLDIRTKRTEKARKLKMKLITKTDYVNNSDLHDEYYGQFVNESILLCVKRGIGEERIKNSAGFAQSSRFSSKQCTSKDNSHVKYWK